MSTPQAAAPRDSMLVVDDVSLASDWDRSPTVDIEARPRARRRPRRLARYLATLFVGTVAPLVLLAAVLIYKAASSERETVQKSMVDVARTLSTAVDSEIGRTMLGLQILAMSPALDSSNIEAFRQEAEAARALHGRWSNVVLVRVDGTRLLNLRVPRGTPIPAGNDDSFVEAARRGETLVSDLRTSPTSNKHLVYVSVPVIRTARPRYALVATMESDLWTEWLKTQVPQGSIAAIDDRSGVIFARSERPDDFVGRTAADPLRATYATAPEGVVQVGNREGTRLYVAFHTSATTGWHSLILMPAGVVDARLNRYIVLLGAASLGVMALAFLAAFVVARPLRTATAEVKEAITSLGRGDRPPARALPIAELDEAHRAAELAGELLRSAQRAVRNRTAQFEALLASAPIGAYLVDSRGRLAAVNPAAEHMVEDDDDIVGENFREVIRTLWSANADTLLAALDRTLLTGERTYLAELHDAARHRTYEWHMERLPLPNGSRGVVCYFRDVTAHVEARAELLRQREELKTIYDTAPVGLCVIDSEMRFVRINRLLAEINGLPIEAHIGKSVRELLPGVADAVEPVLREVIRTGLPVLDYEVSGETPAQPGVRRVWIESWHPIKDAGGAVTGINVVAREVTEQRRAEEALRATVASLRRAQGQLEAADRQKDEFLAMLAHELRNPLTPIGNACELLARTFPAHREAQLMVGMIRRQVAQLTRLVDDLLDVSRITQGRIELKRETLDLADVVSHAVETVEPLVREKRHALSLVSSYRRLFVHGDFARLVQCLVNVLNNAAKYTDPGGELRIETAQEGAEAVITVTDNGPGIPQELLPHVFDLFVQGDRTLDRSQGGLGIGLSVVQQLIEQHGGHVTARSAGSGCGSAFEIRLPLADAPVVPCHAEAPPPTAPRRVLIVDDNADAADSLALVLATEGHAVQVAYDGAGAIERVRSFAPDVVFLDIGLPQMDGYEVARRIRALPGGAAIRLVALTGYGQAEDIARTRATGFDDHIVKPVDMRAVLQSIADVEAPA